MSLLKLKLFLRIVPYKLSHFRAGRIYKKSKKMPERYEDQWKFDWIMKKARKYFRIFKIKVTVSGYENLPKSNFVLAPNHQSSIDIPSLIIAMRKQTDDREVANRRVVFLAKKEIKKNKWGKNFALLLDSFFIDREDPRQALTVTNELAKYLTEHSGVGVVIFPEGTRSRNGELGHFKGAALRLAKKSFLPIIPVTINNSALAMQTKRKWINVEVIFHKPLKPLEFLGMSNQDLADHVKKIIASKFITHHVFEKAHEKQF